MVSGASEDRDRGLMIRKVDGGRWTDAPETTVHRPPSTVHDLPWLKWTLIIAYVALAGAVAALYYRTGDVSSDFDVFWRAGHRFLHGQPLYPSEPIDTSFLYPPFAAFLFQFLALFPFRVAAAGAVFVNALLFPVAIWLTWDIVSALLPTPRRRAWPFILATAVSFRFFQADAAWIQTNLIILVLVLAGIAAGRRERWSLAAAAIIVAAGIKVVPLIFLGWLLLRGPRRALTVALPIALGVIALPLLWRGPAQGWLDLTQYLQGFLAEYLSGGVRIRWDNYNLATLAYSPFVALDDPSGMGGTWLPGGLAAGTWLYRGAALAVVTTWVGMVVVLRRAQAEWNVFELAAGFLAGLLLSGVTWAAHLVPLLFVCAVLFSACHKERSQPLPILLWSSIVLALVSGVGRDVLGPTVYDGIRAYHVIRLFLLVSYLTTLLLAVSTAARTGARGHPAELHIR